MRIVSPHTQAFIDGLNAKFGDSYTYSAMPGIKYDRIVSVAKSSTQRIAFAFVDGSGNVYKTNGWQAPAKGVRFTSVAAALAVADPYTSFLYKR
jgi:hypothetical protein